MAQRSKIAKLPKNLRAKIDGFLAEGERSVDEFVGFINQLLDAMGRTERVSRSGAHRYMAGYEKIVEDIRKSRMLAEVLVKPLGEGDEERVARLNIELVHTLVMKLLLGQEDGAPVSIDAKEAMFLGTALAKLSAAQKIEADRALQLRKAFAGEAAKAAADVAKARGLSADTVQAIEHAVLGIAR